ncbi:hypothetical protein SK128_016651 [Halocaridina rubra]|uniref:Uncharacterized protein n=1 Tax=Halocaridina rubra TaxID=373956 RepID=A0AAN8WHT7_HALRR
MDEMNRTDFISGDENEEYVEPKLGMAFRSPRLGPLRGENTPYMDTLFARLVMDTSADDSYTTEKLRMDALDLSHVC